MNRTRSSMRTAFALGLGALAGLAAVQVIRARRRAHAEEPEPFDAYQTESITINQPIERVYEAWRSLEGLGFAGNADITDAREQEMFAWTSSNGSSGIVRFQPAPGARGTEVHVELTRKAGIRGTGIARVLGMAPDQQVREDLRRFKQRLETGEVALSAFAGAEAAEGVTGARR